MWVNLWLSGAKVRRIGDERIHVFQIFHFPYWPLIVFPPPRKGSPWLLFWFGDNGLLFECTTPYCENCRSLRTTDCQRHHQRALIGETSSDRQTMRVSSFRLPGSWTVATACRRETYSTVTCLLNYQCWTQQVDVALLTCTPVWELPGLTIHHDTLYPDRAFSWFHSLPGQS